MDSIAKSTDKSLTKLWEMVKDREVWHAVVYEVERVRQDLATESESVSHSVLSPWTVACQAPLHGILQARILEWVTIPISRGSS